MARIRMKVKYLLLIGGFSIILLMPLVFPSPINYLAGRVAENLEQEISSAFYERSINHGGIGALASANRQLDQLIEQQYEYLEVYMASGYGTSGIRSLSEESIDKLNQEYEQFKEQRKKSDSFGEYELKMGIVNFFSGEREKGIAIVEKIDYLKDEGLEEIRQLHLACMYLVRGQYEQGYEQLQNLSSKQYPEFQDELMRLYYFLTGNFTQFQQMGDENELPMKYYDEPLLKPLAVRDMFYGFNRFIQLSEKSKIDNGNRLVGKVKYYSEERPVVLVSLDPVSNRHGYSTIDVVSTEAMRAVMVNPDGSFVIDNIPDGQYKLAVSTWSAIAVDTNVAFDKGEVLRFTGDTQLEENIGIIAVNPKIDYKNNQLTVDLTDYEDVYSMEVKLIRDFSYGDGSIVHIPVFEKKAILGNRATINGDKIMKEFQIRFYQGRTEDGKPVPKMYLPIFYLDTPCWVGVKAYDKDGNMLFDSAENMNKSKGQMIVIEGQEPDEADKLLLEGKYEEAIPLYEERSQEGDSFATAILANIYFNGYIPNDSDEWNNNGSKFAGADCERALSYLQQLEKEYPSNATIMEIISSCYEELGQNEKALEYILPLLEENEFYAYVAVRLYAKLGDYQKAQYYSKWDYGWDSVDERYVMYTLLLNDEKGIQSLRHDEDYLYSMPSLKDGLDYYEQLNRKEYHAFYTMVQQGKIDEAKQFLQQRDDDLSYFYQCLLAVVGGGWIEERSEQFYPFYGKINDQKLKQWLNAMTNSWVAETM